MTAARLTLCEAAKISLANVLTMLKITVPEHMDSLEQNAE